MHTTLIRFNTEHNNTPLKWRVLIDNIEYSASHVICKNVICKTTEDTLKDGRIKYHVTVISRQPPKWEGDQLFIED